MPSAIFRRAAAAALCASALTLTMGGAAGAAPGGQGPHGVGAEQRSANAPEHAGTPGRPDHAGTPGRPDHAAGGETCRFGSAEGAAEPARDSLAAVAPEGMVIGTIAAGGGHHADADYPDPFPDDAEYRDVLAADFSSVTPENYLKWESLRPAEGEYDFEQADAVVAWAQENGIDVRGHALFWHSQNPDWLEDGDYSAEELHAILEDHVRTVVSRYAGCIDQWDVANEIFTGDGRLRTEENIWLRELGPGILDDVFRWAHEEDPGATLFYNDYNAEGINAKTDAYYELAAAQLERGVPVGGFGAQSHLSMQYGFDDSLQANMERFDALGLKTAVTEIDVRGTVGEDGQMSPEDRAGAAERYAQVLDACLAVEGCTSFTVWGTLDEHSWVPGTFPGEGDALIMEGDYERKSSYCTLQRTLVEHTEGAESWEQDEAFSACRGILDQAGL
ncbi:endo-1,4-beta-xylanase [Nesterenkonia halobia]|uniref:Beta-xylanase n=1 Tax=Nesterenkonia halobia TaxID=37922 RepID=A0ABP6RD01_9MICC